MLPDLEPNPKHWRERYALEHIQIADCMRPQSHKETIAEVKGVLKVNTKTYGMPRSKKFRSVINKSNRYNPILWSNNLYHTAMRWEPSVPILIEQAQTWRYTMPTASKNKRPR